MSWKFSMTAAALCMCALCVPVGASAAPGEGIRSDSLQLNLGVDLGTQLNTNLFFEEDQTAPLALSGRVTPSISLSTLNSDFFKLNVNWDAGWQQYFSDDVAVAEQSGFSTTLTALAAINPNGAFSLTLSEALTRTNEPTNSPTTASFNRLNNDLGATIGIHPGGKVFQFYAGYNWGKFTYNEAISDLTKDEHRLNGRFIWKFFPKSTANITANYRFIFYEQAERSLGAGSSLANNNSTPLRLTAGVDTLVLSNLAVGLNAGYGWTFYEAGPDTSEFLFNGHVRLLFDSVNRFIGLAYERGFDDSLLGNFQLDNRVALNTGWSLADEKLNLGAGVELIWRGYRLPETNGAAVNGGVVELPDEINDLLIGGRANVSYAFTPWLSLMAEYSLRINNADPENVPILTRGDAVIAGRNFFQNVVDLGLRLQY
jgi:hypothetical protein